MKNNLIIINPYAGKRKANSHLSEIVEIFTKAGYACTVLPTLKQGDGTNYVLKYGKNYNLITAIGGDGTFNEVVSGVTNLGIDIPIGYIPAGSTNDFATSLNLPTRISSAAKDIVIGEPVSYDIGDFNGRKFSYVASFGAFTETSYATSQNVKNTLGHLAYLLEGAVSIPSIRPEHMKIEANGEVYEDDYLFGAITNSTSVGGLLKLDKKLVDMNDGLFEMLLIKYPKDPLHLANILHEVLNQNFNSKEVVFITSSEFKITANSSINWSLDGEYQEGADEIVVKNIPGAIKLMVNKKRKPKGSDIVIKF